MSQHEIRYFVGIDGGGTKTRATIADLNGKIIGVGISSGANLALGSEIAKSAVDDSLAQAMKMGDLAEQDMKYFSVCMGLAGANIDSLKADFEKRLTIPFASLYLTWDAEIACVGAHAGEDGAIAILGTGSSFLGIHQGESYSFGGWGFRLGDHSSGAWIGRYVLELTLLAHDQILPKTPLSQKIFMDMGGSSGMIEFAQKAEPYQYAELAPLVFAHDSPHDSEVDEIASMVVQRAITDLLNNLNQLKSRGAKKIALMGGLASHFQLRLPQSIQANLISPQGEALQGALILAGLSLARQKAT